MTVVSTLPIVVALIGALVWLLCTGPRLSRFADLGKIAFGCGLLVAIWATAGMALHLGR